MCRSIDDNSMDNQQTNSVISKIIRSSIFFSYMKYVYPPKFAFNTQCGCIQIIKSDI